jgi:hypothetical protein
MRKTNKRKLIVGRETLRALSESAMSRAVGGGVGDAVSNTCLPDNSYTWCPSYSDVNSCVAMCGL